jgi:hypothetical protein
MQQPKTMGEFLAQKCRDLASTLPETVYITSIETKTGFLEAAGQWKPGVTMAAQRDVAADRIVWHQTHRLATEEEIEAMRAEQKQRTEECVAAERANRRQESMHFSMALAEAVKSLGPKNATA